MANHPPVHWNDFSYSFCLSICQKSCQVERALKCYRNDKEMRGNKKELKATVLRDETLRLFIGLCVRVFAFNRSWRFASLLSFPSLWLADDVLPQENGNYRKTTKATTRGLICHEIIRSTSIPHPTTTIDPVRSCSIPPKHDRQEILRERKNKNREEKKTRTGTLDGRKQHSNRNEKRLFLWIGSTRFNGI